MCKFSSFIFVCFQETNVSSAINVRNVSCGVTTSQSITKHTSTQRACEHRLSQDFKNFGRIKKKNALPGPLRMEGNKGQTPSRVRHGPGKSPVYTSCFRVDYTPAVHFFLLSLIVRGRLVGRKVGSSPKIHKEHGCQLCFG